ncbi:metal-dependent hydrolase family protein [Natrononativus amylolyticus]|uniref:metal-dependent hydrolase family protein n=1 Tax=Natrononativus amylolyticus TaxID=2963434 RepID=UPI0020CF06F7|nr:amidohydrolase family protein [Natrononativus amylolyticus]
MVVLVGGTVVDADGSRVADVAVEDGRIVAVGDDVDAPGAELDVSGRFVTPGLVDAHVHLGLDGRPDIATLQLENTYDGAYRAAANLEAALEAGVTTVRDLGARGTMAIDAARAVDAGVVAGPRVVASGEVITMTGGHSHWLGREADGADNVRAAAREQLKRGAEVVKCMATGGVLTEGTRTGVPELTREELAAAAAVAHAAGRTAAAHAHGREGIENAVEAGFDSVEHGTFMDRDVATRMAERGTYWVPTANAVHGICDAGAEGGIPAETVAKADAALEAFDDAFDHALAADVPIAMGTDAGTPFNEFSEIPRELVRLVDHGLTPAAALEAATVGSASLLGFDDLGLVREGYRADLLVLENDPLEDPSAWQHVDRVLSDGRLV